MVNRLEIKGKQNAFEVISQLLNSGYSVHMPYMGHDTEDDEKNYFIIEYSFTKYDEPRFVLEED